MYRQLILATVLGVVCTFATAAPADWLAWAPLGTVWVIALVPIALPLAGRLRARRARA